MALKFPFRTKSASSTTGTGTYTLSEPTSAGWRNLTRAVTDGDLASGDSVAYAVIDTTVTGGPKLLEVGVGVYDNTAKTLTRAQVLQPNGAAVSWGAGTRDVIIVDNPLLYLKLASNLSDLASASAARGNLGLGTSAVLDVGTTASKVVQLTAAAKYPAVDGSLITNIPGVIPAGTVMVFYQSAAPSGWTRHATLDDYVVRIVKNGSTNGNAGTVGGSSWTNLSTDSHVLTAAELPTLAVTTSTTVGVSGPGAFATVGQGAGGGGGHVHTVNAGGGWRPPSIDCLLATKD